MQEWRDTDEKFISTSTTTSIRQSLNKNRGVLITGFPGCGKSVTAHHVALQLEREGYEVIPCDDPSDILKHFSSEKTQVFVFDDVCGKIELNQHKADSWNRNDYKCHMLIDSSNKVETKLLFTCRENIYLHKAFPKLTYLSLVNWTMQL